MPLSNPIQGEELVEAVARTLAGWTPNVTSWADICDNPKQGDTLQTIFHLKARAIIPVVLEAAAKRADEIGESYGEDEAGWFECSETIAQAIRALSSSQGREG